MLVSMIIPVYNVEKYIRKCLESVASQTYDNLEVIIVNDGTRDHSQDIIDEFCSKYENFYSYITENHGLGGARNFGLTKAHGDYVCFLDSDDYIADNFVEVLAKRAMQDHSDIVVCNNIDVIEETGKQVKTEAVYTQNPTTLWEDKKILFNRVSAWAKLYRRNLFQGVAYEARAWYEDMRLTPKLYAKANQISYVDDALLYYMIREGSIMTSTNAQRNLEIIDAFEDLRTYFQSCGQYEQLKYELEYLMLDHIFISAISRITEIGSKTNHEFIQQLYDYVISYPDIFKNPYLATMQMNRKLIFYCNRYKMYAITRFLLKMKKKFNRR